MIRRPVALGLLVAAVVSGCSPTHRARASTVLSVSVGGPGSPLPGTLVLPAGRGPFPAVVLVGGSGPNDHDETLGANKPFRDLANGLAAHGVATLRYDKRTLVYRAQTAALLSTFTPADEYVPDAVAAVQLLRRRREIDPRRVFVLGHSQGGSLAPRIAMAEPHVAGVILMAAGAAPFGATLVRQVRYLARFEPPGSPQVVLRILSTEQQAARIDDPNLALSTPASELPGGIGPPYWLDITHHDPVAIARSLPQPLLVLQGERDYQVTVADDLSRWESGLAGRSGVTVHRYPRANHLFIDGQGPSRPSEYDVASHVDSAVIDDIAAWILKAG